MPREATQEQIRHAYRAHLRTSHPDTGERDQPADPTVQQVIDAYRILGDPVRRAEYDRGTVLGGGSSPTRVRVTVRRRADSPPIQVRPVQWHRLPPGGTDPTPARGR